MSFYLKDERNLAFLCCAILGFLTPLTNIISIECITGFPRHSITFSTFIAEVYFILLGMQMMFYSSYCYSFISTFKKHRKLFHIFLGIPFAIYIIIMLLNLKTGWVFKYDETSGYTRGPFKLITYVTSLFYIGTVIFTILVHRKTTSTRIFYVFLSYPIISCLISAIQFYSPYTVLTGLSSFAPLMLMYLGVQSEQIAHDFATGVFTEKQLPSTINNRKHNWCLTVISVENYTAYKDTYGTLETDRMMLIMAKDLLKLYGRKVFRSPTSFAVLTRSLEEIESTISFFYNLQKTSESHREAPELIAASVQLPENAETYEQAIAIINNLLAKNRANGTDYCYCDDIYVANIKREKAIYDILDRELNPDSEKFQVHFQPIYSVHEKKFKYSEALARLQNTELGNISPGEFIPVAESKGLIERLGQITFEKICKHIRDNKDTVEAVSVNFSVQQMSNPRIVDTVLDTIEKYNIDPKNIIMEITESIFIENFEEIQKRMEKLAKAGIVFYLDDFGTGFSNFANVITLPFSTIKIDRSFVLMMEKNEKMYNLVKSLIQTFKNNGLKILVEGVETEAQDVIVKNAGTDYIQGFLYSRPLPDKECLELFSKQKSV
ncbi:EAL domain-containing protein [Treponema sp.]|uniref:EAL domain-containing protein n=1 Tax=Treponema sp. TaxID=166 RepID=UPI00388EA967